MQRLIEFIHLIRETRGLIFDQKGGSLEPLKFPKFARRAIWQLALPLQPQRKSPNLGGLAASTPDRDVRDDRRYA